MTAVQNVLAEIEEQLAWRGPNGGKMGHIVLPRDKMEMLMRAVAVTKWRGALDKIDGATDGEAHVSGADESRELA
jgi:hypothetical protein